MTRRLRDALAPALVPGAVVAGVALLAATLAAGQPAEQPGVATLPPPGDHWLWVPDRLLGHNLLFDGDSGEVLGMIDSPSLLTPKLPQVSRARGEIYSTDIAHSRGMRGERVDFVSIYDLESLDFVDEVLLPTRSGTSNSSLGYAELVGDRFLAVFNQFPRTSISIVDVEQRAFVEEIVVGGCAGVFPIDARRLASLCGDGTALVVELDDAGRKAAFRRSDPFFDVVEDPVFMAAGRHGLTWSFVSFAGRVHPVDFAGAMPIVGDPWSLLDAEPPETRWRPGGLQHVAVHEASGRLWVVMHEGGPGSHKEAGPEIWGFDLESRERVARVAPPPLTAVFLGGLMGMDPEGFAQRLLAWLLPQDGVHSIAVTQDAEPLLFMRNADLGAVGVVDATSGETLRVMNEAGLVGPTLGTF